MTFLIKNQQIKAVGPYIIINYCSFFFLALNIFALSLLYSSLSYKSQYWKKNSYTQEHIKHFIPKYSIMSEQLEDISSSPHIIFLISNDVLLFGLFVTFSHLFINRYGCKIGKKIRSQCYLFIFLFIVFSFFYVE